MNDAFNDERDNTFGGLADNTFVGGGPCGNGGRDGDLTLGREIMIVA